MENKKVTLDKGTRFSVMFRSMFLQGSWNYERMQNGGWAFALIPALKKLYPGKEESAEALKRHLEFFNTHPYVAAPIIGVTLALEEERAAGADIDDAAIQGVKVGMMGPLAGIGDPVFWFTVRPIVGAIAASLATGGSIIAPLFFFIVWNAIRIAFLWYTQEFGYKQGSAITQDLGGGMLQQITKGASILGMFILGALIQRWVTINFVTKLPATNVSAGGYVGIDKTDSAGNILSTTPVDKLHNITGTDLNTILGQVAGGRHLGEVKQLTIQNNLDTLIPGLAALLLTFACIWLLRRKVSPIVIIFGLFIIGILGRWVGIF